MQDAVAKAKALYEDKEQIKASVSAERMMYQNEDTDRLGTAELHFFQHILKHNLVDVNFADMA